MSYSYLVLHPAITPFVHPTPPPPILHPAITPFVHPPPYCTPLLPHSYTPPYCTPLLPPLYTPTPPHTAPRYYPLCTPPILHPAITPFVHPPYCTPLLPPLYTPTPPHTAPRYYPLCTPPPPPILHPAIAPFVHPPPHTAPRYYPFVHSPWQCPSADYEEDAKGRIVNGGTQWRLRPLKDKRWDTPLTSKLNNGSRDCKISAPHKGGVYNHLVMAQTTLNTSLNTGEISYNHKLHCSLIGCSARKYKHFI